jgi:hypothetical protein
MKILFVGGDFDDGGGRTSGYCKKIGDILKAYRDANTDVNTLNGGFFDLLENIVIKEDFLVKYDVIIWFANVPNNKPKLIRQIKTLHPKCILVTSKSNMTGEYSNQDLIYRALENKANLLVEFTKQTETFGGNICYRVIDPLANCWGHGVNIHKLILDVLSRVDDLQEYTRVGSVQIGPAIVVPEENNFFDFIRSSADRFHELIHGVEASRFLGNASFRCTNGFPSMRGDDGLIYVSKRNIDKRNLGINGFVACEGTENVVEYYGEHKPSVDTPIQIMLYNFYENINYMMHSHVYVKNAPFTAEKIPCGATEEAYEIIAMFPWSDINHFAINLKGHGCLILVSDASDLDFYKDKFIARPVFED